MKTKESKFTNFESIPLPDPLPDDLRMFVTELEARHEEEPFSATDPRATVVRVRKAAAACALTGRLQVYRGAVEGVRSGFSADHVWLSADGRLIELAWPLFDERFFDKLRDYTTGVLAGADFEIYSKGRKFSHRPLGRFPSDKYAYIGEPVWRDR